MMIEQLLSKALGTALVLWICIPMGMAFRSKRENVSQNLLQNSKYFDIPLNYDDDEYTVRVAVRDILREPHESGSRREERMATRKPVIWLHLHKAGGTLMCSLAKMMKEHVIQPEVTCNLENPGLLRSLPSAPTECDGVAQMGQSKHRLTCEERARYYQRGNHTWGQIERELNIEDLECGDSFMYGIMLREPMGLVLSDLNFNHWHQNDLTAWLNTSKTSTCDRSGPCKHAGHPELGWQLFDNFAIRSLTGYKGWWKPPGTINQADLEEAKERLDLMDIVLILEDLNDSKAQIEEAFGWKNVELKVVNNYGGKKEGLTPKNEAYLARLNRFDQSLYEYAKKLRSAKTPEPTSLD